MKKFVRLALFMALLGATIFIGYRSVEANNGGVIKNIDYQHEQEGKPKFEYGYISIEDPNNPGHGITILDRNLGAKTTGAGPLADEDSYGYYYQWGNNYGFPTTGDINNITNEPIDASLYRPSEYYSDILIQNLNNVDYFLLESDAENMWGGGRDVVSGNMGYDADIYLATNLKDRQGPCPVGTHVPSQGEWNAFIRMWWATNSGNYEEGTYDWLDDARLLSYLYDHEEDRISKDFYDLFQIPFAGRRLYNDATLLYTGINATLWSSSPYYSNLSGYVRSIHVKSDYLYPSSYHIDGIGLSVRCFANEYKGVAPAAVEVTVTFNTNGGTAVDSQTVDSGSVAIEPSAPTKTGFVFDGWYEDSTLHGNKFDFSTPITGDITLYAKWTTDKFKIDETDGLYKSELGYYVIDENDARYPQGCNTPGLPEPEKYCILAIYADETRNGWEGSNCSIREGFVNCRKGMVLIAPGDTDILKDGYNANSYCNSMNIGGMGFELPISHAGTWRDMVDNRDKIYNFTASGSSKANHYRASPKEPTNINCTVSGSCGGEGSSTLLSVRCVSRGYVVVFETNGGSQINKLNKKYVTLDSRINEPNSELSGSTLEGWYKDNQLIDKWDFDVDKVNENMTLYAKRIPNVYTITFDTDGGSDIAPITGQYNSPVVVPLDPTKTGYTFVGRDQTIPANIPANDITITAQRTINQYTIRFVDEDGTTVLSSMQYPYGTDASSIIKPSPTKSGDAHHSYVFAGWTPAVSTVTKDATYKATYTETTNKYVVTWKNENGDILKVDTLDYGKTPNYTGPTPTKAEDSEYRYHFSGWSPLVTSVSGNITYTATYASEKKGGNRSGGGGRGGGGGGEKPSDPIPSDPQHPSADEPVPSNPEPSNPEPSNPEPSNPEPSNPIPSNPSPKGGNKPPKKEYKPETIDAHERAYENGFTHYADINDAKLEKSLNRQEMAKITSIFATEFLDKTPDESKQKICSQYSDMRKVNSEMKFFITQSCELGYMGYESNGVNLLERFRPYTSLTLAEASTVLSRIMRGGEYVLEGKNWYKGHLYAVYNHELIDDIRKPNSDITREQAFLMLYRMYKNMEK